MDPAIAPAHTADPLDSSWLKNHYRVGPGGAGSDTRAAHSRGTRVRFRGEIRGTTQMSVRAMSGRNIARYSSRALRFPCTLQPLGAQDRRVCGYDVTRPGKGMGWAGFSRKPRLKQITINRPRSGLDRSPPRAQEYKVAVMAAHGKQWLVLSYWECDSPFGGLPMRIIIC